MESTHDVAVVVPVYQGEECLPSLLDELLPLAEEQTTEGGVRWRVVEVVLVHDCGPDRSDRTIRRLAEAHPTLVRPVWLTRNFGQHAATVAGFASSSAPWIVTLDEDGQHDPAQIGALLDHALATGSALVYARPEGGAPHARWRNAASNLAKRLVEVVSGVHAKDFSSFRLIVGERARAVAAYCGQGVYLDVALSWIVADVSAVTVPARVERRPGSGYGMLRLLSHFSALVLSSGTRPLRFVAASGVVLALSGLVGAVYILVVALTSEIPVPGWASISVTLLVTAGALLFSIGVVAGYVGTLLGIALGRPLYVISTDPQDLPLAADPERG